MRSVLDGYREKTASIIGLDRYELIKEAAFIDELTKIAESEKSSGLGATLLKAVSPGARQAAKLKQIANAPGLRPASGWSKGIGAAGQATKGVVRPTAALRGGAIPQARGMGTLGIAA